ncbi:PTS sugar transporter subunit IIB [Breznakia pachnodae]|uniref:PTS system cellobiose-specific IIB component n=1 Tax=Breznakia pachnodae TaxID=265178 RepID=A0ABU0E8J1_9FIRM|nr:PTS sugar transporter subunit IIB [Breznakia pachnodae]MDQ0363034.1 PTS system cellobiose-specific IIB component [Breznakia pachnodae]
MKKVILLCSAGMSTSMLVENMKEAALNKNYDYQIEAHSLTELNNVKDSADIILLGPQVRFQLDSVKKQVECQVEVIPMTDYGQMNGSKVVELVHSLVG